MKKESWFFLVSQIVAALVLAELVSEGIAMMRDKYDVAQQNQTE